MSGRFRIRNWRKFQRYKDRSPTWIAVYVELLDDLDFEALDDATRWHVVAIWLLAARYDEPKKDPAGLGPELPWDPEWIRGKAGLDSAPDLQAIADAGFIVRNNSLRPRNEAVPDCDEGVPLAGAGASLPSVSVSVGEGEPEGEGSREAAWQVLDEFQELFGRTVARGGYGYLQERLEEGATLEQCRAVMHEAHRDVVQRGRAVGTPNDVFAARPWNVALRRIRDRDDGAGVRRGPRRADPELPEVLVEPGAAARWERAREQIAQTMDPHSFDTWIRPLAAAGEREPGRFVLLAPNEIFVDWVEQEKFSGPIRAAIGMEIALEVGRPAQPRAAERSEATA